MRRIVCLALVAAATSAAAVSATAAVERTPALRLIDNSPITFRGSSFKARERVTVTATNGTVRRIRIVRATAMGAFSAVFTQLRFDPCNLEARAVGASGSRARFKLPERMCPISGAPADLADARR